jgi:hypothetical protein
MGDDMSNSEDIVMQVVENVYTCFKREFSTEPNAKELVQRCKVNYETLFNFVVRV